MILSRALLSGTAAASSSSLALALLARAEGKGALQPVNSTSHWLHGPRAAAVTAFDARHTLVGAATHAAATVFWALIFEPVTPAARGPKRARNALAVSALAAAVDYTITPKRFTPGWEFVLSKRAMAVAYAAMAAGLALATNAPRRRV